MEDMKLYNKNLLIGSSVTIAVFLLLIVPQAHAANPQFLVTWKATGSYIPSAYIGKALPTYGSEITASLEMISNGKMINLSGQTIYWYLNSTLLGGGVGAQTITFPPLGEAPNAMVLEVDLPNYNGAFLIDTVAIPMVEPQAVIYAPYPSGQFSSNPVTIAAIPYFFNIGSPDNLSYSWSVNSQTGSNAENPEQAEITLPAGTTAGTSFAVSLSVENPGDSTQATAAENLIYQPAP